jgi:hypothetical protein
MPYDKDIGTSRGGPPGHLESFIETEPVGRLAPIYLRNLRKYTPGGGGKRLSGSTARTGSDTASGGLTSGNSMTTTIPQFAPLDALYSHHNP